MLTVSFEMGIAIAVARQFYVKAFPQSLLSPVWRMHAVFIGMLRVGNLCITQTPSADNQALPSRLFSLSLAEYRKKDELLVDDSPGRAETRHRHDVSERLRWRILFGVSLHCWPIHRTHSLLPRVGVSVEQRYAIPVFNALGRRMRNKVYEFDIPDIY